MARIVIAVVVGYVVMAFMVFVSFSVAMFAFGSNAAFRPGTYDPSMPWVLTSFVLSFISAVAGGWVCATIAKTWKAPIALAILILGLGLLLVVYVRMIPGEDLSPVSSRNTSASSAMRLGQQPFWVTMLNPVIGAGGIILGARLRSSRRDV